MGVGDLGLCRYHVARPLKALNAGMRNWDLPSQVESMAFRAGRVVSDLKVRLSVSNITTCHSVFAKELGIDVLILIVI